MKNQRLQKVIAAALLVAAVAMLVAGVSYKRRVYDDAAGDFAQLGMLTFTRVRDVEMAVDATFSGIVRKEGRLYSTYDRMAPRGKRTCPT